jgi:hypothetical protein
MTDKIIKWLSYLSPRVMDHLDQPGTVRPSQATARVCTPRVTDPRAIDPRAPTPEHAPEPRPIYRPARAIASARASVQMSEHLWSRMTDKIM